MEEAKKVWDEICTAIQRHELNSTKLSTLLHKYINALPPEWRRRSLALLTPQQQQAPTVIPLEELPRLVETDEQVRQLFIELVRVYLKVKKPGEG